MPMTILDRNFNLSQRMVQELGNNIVCGEYSKKEDIPTEADLCEKFGVSRSAVREAVKMLSAKGLISSTPRKGITILPENQWNIFDPDLLKWMLQSKPSMNVLKEFLQMRIAIEPEAAALAARLGDNEKIKTIEKSLQRMYAAEPHSDEDLEADIAFHISILYASNNRFYIRLRDFIQTALRVSISHTSSIKGDHQSTLDDHTKVFNAIKSGNAERAKQAMTQLVDEALSFIEQELQKKN